MPISYIIWTFKNGGLVSNTVNVTKTVKVQQFLYFINENVVCHTSS